MGDSIKYCEDCETNVACHLRRGCLRLSGLCPSDETPCSRLRVCDLDKQFCDAALKFQPHEKFREMRSYALRMEEELERALNRESAIIQFCVVEISDNPSKALENAKKLREFLSANDQVEQPAPEKTL